MSEETNVQQPGAVQEVEDNTTPDFANVASVKKGDVVKGKIVKIEDNQAIVDIGYKYDGVIPVKELSSIQLENAASAVQVGQDVELKVMDLNDDKERLVLSKRAVDSEKAWEELQGKLDSGEILEAEVAEVVKGGLVVDVGVRGFIPASMVERHFVEDFSDYKGRTLKLKVKEIDREKNKVVLSQKDVLDEEFEVKKQQIMAGLSVGQQIEGTVQRLTQFGAFIDIGGIDGLVHISEMAWHHVQQPSEVVQEGDKVTVQVLKVDTANDRISLSIRAAQPGPWQAAAGQFEANQIVTGTVKRLVAFGAFVEIAPGVEGLVHISQIAHRHIGTPHEVLKEGQEVQVKVLEFNADEKRVSLSIKETEEAPAQAPRPEKRSEKVPQIQNDNVSMSNQSMSTTLGELFGDKLKKFK
ncbi:MAG: ribosomal protein [Paenibacillus sp.]|nr:ribosomal protein [Paenibacillus sp.]